MKKNEKGWISHGTLVHLVYLLYVSLVVITHMTLNAGIALIGFQMKNKKEKYMGVGLVILMFGLMIIDIIQNGSRLFSLLSRMLSVLSWIYVIPRLIITYPATIKDLENRFPRLM